MAGAEGGGEQGGDRQVVRGLGGRGEDSASPPGRGAWRAVGRGGGTGSGAPRHSLVAAAGRTDGGTRMQGPALMGWTRETPTEGGRSDRILAVLESRGDRVC